MRARSSVPTLIRSCSGLHGVIFAEGTLKISASGGTLGIALDTMFDLGLAWDWAGPSPRGYGPA